MKIVTENNKIGYIGMNTIKDFHDKLILIASSRYGQYAAQKILQELDECSIHSLKNDNPYNPVDIDYLLNEDNMEDEFYNDEVCKLLDSTFTDCNKIEWMFIQSEDYWLFPKKDWDNISFDLMEKLNKEWFI